MIKVLIADDHAIMRAGLRQILTATADMVVAGEATHGQSVLEQLNLLECHVILLDMSMPGLSGLDLIRRLRIDRPKLPILVLSMHNEGQIVTRALRAGASGYVTKDSDPNVLLTAIRKVAQGGKFIDPALIDSVVLDISDVKMNQNRQLTDREFQVLQMIAAGHTINKIAESLYLSAKTVSTHKIRLMHKLGIDNNAGLIRYAIQHGLVLE
ncbi:MAG: response regulator transcription factor [Rhodoferax sp.]